MLQPRRGRGVALSFAQAPVQWHGIASPLPEALALCISEQESAIGEFCDTIIMGVHGYETGGSMTELKDVDLRELNNEKLWTTDAHVHGIHDLACSTGGRTASPPLPPSTAVEIKVARGKPRSAFQKPGHPDVPVYMTVCLRQQRPPLVLVRESSLVCAFAAS